MIGSVQCELCMKMLRNLSEKLRAKFPLTTLGYSKVRISHLDDDFLGILELEASPVEVKHLRSKKIRKGGKGKVDKF